MVVGKDEKLVRVKLGVHKRLAGLREFPDRSTFSDVVEWLLDEQEKREEAKELLK
jgi:hypothetical protein